jgi:hypothetical protein
MEKINIKIFCDFYFLLYNNTNSVKSNIVFLVENTDAKYQLFENQQVGSKVSILSVCAKFVPCAFSMGFNRKKAIQALYILPSNQLSEIKT